MEQGLSYSSPHETALVPKTKVDVEMKYFWTWIFKNFLFHADNGFYFFFSQLFVLCSAGKKFQVFTSFGCLVVSSVLICNYSAITILTCQDILSLAAFRAYHGGGVCVCAFSKCDAVGAEKESCVWSQCRQTMLKWYSCLVRIQWQGQNKWRTCVAKICYQACWTSGYRKYQS